MMASDVALVDSDPPNPCCAELKAKYSKSESGRNALRRALKLLEDQVQLLQDENFQLKKECEQAKGQAKAEKNAKDEEISLRRDLEQQLADIKSDVSPSLEIEFALEKDTLVSEVNEIKKLLEKEKKRVESEKKKADTEKIKAAEACKVLKKEKAKFEEEKKRADVEKKRAEEFKASLDASKREVAEIHKMLFEESRKVELAVKRADSEKQKAVMEKKRADSELVKAEEEKKYTRHLTQLLEKEKRTVEALRKELSVGSGAEHDMLKKLFKKKLKYEIKQVKEVRRKMKQKNAHGKLLQQEFSLLKKDADQFSRRIKMIDSHFSQFHEGIDDYFKENKFSLHLHGSDRKSRARSSNVHDLNCQDENELLKMHGMVICDAHYGGPSSTLNSDSLPLHGVSLSDVRSGISSEKETHERAFIINKSQICGVHSTNTFFSDKKLVGSQGKDAPPFPSLSKTIGKSQKERSAFSILSGKVNQQMSAVDLGLESDSNVVSLPGKELKGLNFSSPAHNNFVESSIRLPRKRKKPLNEDKEIPLTIDKKLSQVAENVMDQTPGDFLPQMNEDLVDTGRRNLLQCMNDPPRKSARRKKLADRKKNAVRPCDQNTDAFFMRTIELEGGYLKLLELENEADEEKYKLAISEPLSPSLPNINFIEMTRDKLVDVGPEGNRGFSVEAPTEYNPLLEGMSDAVNAVIDCIEVANSQPNQVEDHQNKALTSSPSCRKLLADDLGMCVDGNRTAPLTSGTSYSSASVFGCQYFVVFSTMPDANSLLRIFLACKNYMLCSTNISDMHWNVADIFVALYSDGNLLPEEKACVLFSVLLHNIVLAAFKYQSCDQAKFSSFCSDFFSAHVDGVASDDNTRTAFLEMCKGNILFCLVEEFLIKREILVYNDFTGNKEVPRGLKGTKIMDGLNEIATLYSERAKADQLIAGAVILSCICRAVDNVSFIWETSYYILLECRDDPSWVLTVLHFFTSICGKKYAEMEGFCYTMSCIEAIVWLLEQNFELLGNEFGFVPCLQCPFANERVSLEQNALELINELFGTAKSCDDSQGKGGRENSSADYPSYDSALGRKQVFSDKGSSIVESAFAITDAVSLLELIAYYKGWDWAYGNIIIRLLECLSFHVNEEVSAAIIILIGQIGRFGIESGVSVQRVGGTLKHVLLGFMRYDTAEKSSLSTQIAALNAFVNVFNLESAKVFRQGPLLGEDSDESNEVMMAARNWFLHLSKEHQLLVMNFSQSRGEDK